MEELLKLIKTSSPVILVVVVVAYFLKFSIEQKIQGVESRVTAIASTSLDIKKDLRSQERDELIAFRVALEKWQDFLLNGLGQAVSQDPAHLQADALTQKDHELFLDVKIELVKCSIYLRDPKLEVRLGATILDIRNLYLPLIYSVMPRLTDCQTQLMPIQLKLNKFIESGYRDASFAPTVQERDTYNRLQTEENALLKEFSDKLVSQYRPIAEKLDDLKSSINQYIYRPITATAVNQD